ncbi:MAG TPA: glycosyl hydrolase family 18 protein [Limnochordia bacterium]|nr:glycosyl hydrolase family 18 protein [Limnochordia bacterium]
MDRGAIIALLSMLFYFTTFLGGSSVPAVEPLVPPGEQRTYEVLGQQGLLVAEAVTVRNAPSAEAQALGVLRDGSREVLILDQEDGWFKIRPHTGPTGWVPAYVLTITPVAPRELDRIILGYYTPGGPAYETLLDHSSKLTAAAPLGWTMDSNGYVHGQFDPQEMGRSLYFAGNQELYTYGHVRVAEQPVHLLASSQLQKNAVQQLVNLVEEWGLKGLLVQVDYAPGQEQYDLFAFISVLRGELAAKGRQLLLGLPWTEGLDYQAASQAANYLVVPSAHPQREPGPVASLPAVEEMLAKITQAVAGSKLILSLATSGLEWQAAGTVRALSHQEVLELAAQHGAKIRWDGVSRTPYFQHPTGEVWFENRYSLKYKLELVDKYDLAGVAFCNLGQEDPGLWDSAAALLIS